MIGAVILTRAIDFFIPPALRRGTSADGRRARVAVGVLLAAVVATLVLGGARMLRSEPTPLMLPVLGGLLALLALSRRTGNVRILGHGVCLVVAAAVTGLTLLAGGVGTVAMSAYALLPLLGTFLGGPRTGLLWTLLSCAAVIVFKVMDVQEIPWPIEAHPERAFPALGTVLFTCGVFALAVAYDFARGRDERMRELREAELAALLSAFPDLVVRLSSNGVCEEIHEGGGASPVSAEAQGRPFAGFFVEEDDVRAAVESGTSVKTELEAHTVDPARTWNLRLAPFEGGVLALARDITEARETEAQLAEARIRTTLERADRMSSIGLLAAGMAHEVNNPLTYLSANLSFAQQVIERRDGTETRGDDGAIVDALTDAQDAVERIRRIVADLKLYARPEDELEAEREACRPEDIVSAALKLARHELQHRATVEVSHADPPPVFGSEARLVQVLLNLLVNAAQAIPPGAASEHRVEVSTGRGEDGCAWIRVRDTGPGIPEAILLRVKEPFFTTKALGVGTGLGLSVCDGIIAQLGGRLEIESVVGEGTSITIRLAAAERVAAAPARRVDPVSEGMPGRILVVDDEPLVRRALRRLLRKHEVVEAESGAEALEILSKDLGFDAILSDVMMPDVTGVDLYKEVCERFPSFRERFVFMTGGAFDVHVRELFAEVSLPVVSKPFRSAEVHGTLAPLIAHARAS